MRLQKGVVALLGDDHMVQYGDSENLSCLAETGCDVLVFPAGIKISRGVIVCDDNGTSVVFDGWDKDFPGMDNCPVHETDRDDSCPDNRVVTIKSEHQEVFLGFSSVSG